MTTYRATCGKRRHEGSLASCLAFAGGLIAVHPQLKARVTNADDGATVADIDVNGIAFANGRRPVPHNVFGIRSGA